MNQIPRRDFLKTTAAASAWFAAPQIMAAPTDRILGANEDVRMAVVGVGRQGSSHLGRLLKMPGVRVVAVADPDTAAQGRAKRSAEEAGVQIDSYTDMRELLARDDVDAVTMATPHHWHVLGGIWALEAGKHLYLEKPVSHNVWEGRQLVRAARKSGRVVQAGTQNRSDTGLVEAFPWIQAGNIGAIQRVVGLCYRNRQGIGKLTERLTPPATLDYDLWLGPAEDRPLYRPSLHYDWHWSWNTGNGDLGNQGPHETDLIQWIRGDGALPRRVGSLGGRFGWKDAGETPNMQLAWFDYGDYPVHFEVRDMWTEPELNASPSYRGIRVGVIVTCEGGEFRGGRGGGWIYDPEGQRIKPFKGDAGGGHMRNFLDAVRANDSSLLHTHIESAHKSAALAHLANISFQLGTLDGPAAAAERLAGQDFLQERLDVFKEQLANWKVDYEATPLTIGPELDFAPAQERFTGGPQLDQANALLSRPHRSPYLVKEIS